jgi:large subunit ribosomal protein L5
MAKEKKQKDDKAAKGGPGVREAGVYPRLAVKYKKEIIPAMMKRFTYKNVMQVPKLEKISVNIGVGGATQDAKLIDTAVMELEAITGQKVAVTKAKKAISNFKLRQGLPIGVRVTLRDKMMYEFFDRLISLAMPQSETSAAFPTDRSTDGEIILSVSKNKLFFPKSMLIRSRRSPEWTLRL